MAKIKWRFAYDGLEEEVSAATAVDFSDDPGYTMQDGKDDADINVLVRRFGVTGQVPRPSMEPFYGDFSEVSDYQSALNQLIEADNAFAGLPSDLRAKFDNEPAKLWNYLHDPELNVEEARALGLLKPEEVPPGPQKVEIVNVPPPPAGSGLEPKPAST